MGWEEKEEEEGGAEAEERQGLLLVERGGRASQPLLVPDSSSHCHFWGMVFPKQDYLVQSVG